MGAKLFKHNNNLSIFFASNSYWEQASNPPTWVQYLDLLTIVCNNFSSKFLLNLLKCVFAIFIFAKFPVLCSGESVWHFAISGLDLFRNLFNVNKHMVSAYHTLCTYYLSGPFPTSLRALSNNTVNRK